MRVLLTGAAGFIGGALNRAMPPEWDVVALPHNGVDLTRYLDLMGLRSTLGDTFDLGIHCAACSDPARPSIAHIASLTMAANLLDVFHFERFVFLSSGAVYDGLFGAVHPRAFLKPTLPYAICKMAAEQLVKRAVKNYVIVRPFGVYGPGEPERKLPTRLCRAGAERLELQGTGENLIDLLYIDDAVNAILALAESSLSGITVDLASRKPLSIKNLVMKASEILGKFIGFHLSGAATEPIHFFSDDRTVETALGWAPQVSLETGLTRLAESLR